MSMKFNSKLFSTITTQTIHDDGILSILEVGKQLPFAVKRVYTIDNCIPNLVRGRHAHKETCQAMFCLRGSVDLLLDNGVKKEIVRLIAPNIGVLIKPRIWHEMKNISRDALLLMFADRHYNENDYIRNYKDFLVFLKKDVR